MPLKEMKLTEWCEGSSSFCKLDEADCNKCTSIHKKLALERKRKGEKIIKPGKKTEAFIEAIEERNALLKQAAATENKETFFKRSYSGKWR